jgi:hypothetical protein
MFDENDDYYVCSSQKCLEHGLGHDFPFVRVYRMLTSWRHLHVSFTDPSLTIVTYIDAVLCHAACVQGGRREGGREGV